MAETEWVRSDREEAALYLARFLAGIGLCVPLTVIMGGAFQLGIFEALLAALFGIPILLALAIAGITSLMMSVRSAMKKAWGRSLMTLILPFVLFLVALNPLGFLYTCDHIGALARFVALKSSYDRQVAALPANQRPGPVVFIWDGFLGASNGVLYDATGQVTLSRRQQSPAWLARASHTELKAATGNESTHCGYSVRPLWDHYYLAGFWC